eukprot:8364021-Pyramimonas_sp.AAC.1
MAQWTNVETPNGIEALLAATKWRTAQVTIKNWAHLYDELHETAASEISLRDVVEGRWCAGCWKDPLSTVQRLHG